MCDTHMFNPSDDNCNIQGLWDGITENMNNDENKFIFKNIKGKQVNFDEQNKYYILNYDKDTLTHDSYDKTGLFRSIVMRDDKILSFSPTKSMNFDMFKEKYSEINHDIVVEEFIEGTMINVFFDKKMNEGNGDWQLASKSSVGCKYSYFQSQDESENITFRTMFLEAMIETGLDFNMFSEKYTYSFVLQHPKNKIVATVVKPIIILVGIYEINNDDKTVKSVDYSSIFNSEDFSSEPKNMFMNHIRVPKNFSSFKTYDEVIDIYASMNTDYSVMGAVIKNKITGERTKVRNPNYENIKHLKGNSPKLQYKYLSLRKLSKVGEYLRYFPEDKLSFSKFRDQLHQYTEALHNNYMKCYVLKEKPLSQFPANFRNHMYKLHGFYIDELMFKSKSITRSFVISYVNDLHQAQQMFVLNYNLRKHNIETSNNEKYNIVSENSSNRA